jgi:cytochrome c peroxidase
VIRLTARFSMGLLVLAGCNSDTITFPDPPPVTTDAQLRQNLANWGVIPIGPMPEQNPALVSLGRALFFDKVLSGNRDIACATCHDPNTFLGDGRSLPVGTGGTGVAPQRVLGAGRQFIPRQAPSLLNSGLGLFYLFWDGRLNGFGSGPFRIESDTVLLPSVPNILAAQALIPVLNRAEMRGEVGDVDVDGNTNELAAFQDEEHDAIWQGVMDRLLAIPEYVQMFAAAFPNTSTSQLRFRHAAEALAAFQAAAFTKTDSPFDRYLDRDNSALSGQAKRGALFFTGEGQCVTCHNGPFLGGQTFANVGAPQIGPGMGKELPLDLGRGEIDNFEFYKFAFRVPPLRNVELTAPYTHSGAYATLEAVVEHYSDVPTAMREYDVSQLSPDFRDSHHGDDAALAEITATLDGRFFRRLDFSEEEKSDLVAFLKSLTDPSARDLSYLVPSRVPSGLPVR